MKEKFANDFAVQNKGSMGLLFRRVASQIV